MTVGELRQLLNAWHEDDDVNIGCDILATFRNTEYCWLEVTGVDDRDKGCPPGMDLCIIDTGRIMGE